MSELKQFFDEWAKVYDEYLPKLPQYQTLVQEIINQIEANKESKILDIGIGTGFTTFGIKRKFGSKVYGIDISEKMLKKCKEKAKKWGLNGLDLQLSNATKLNFEDNYFDVVVSSFTLHHVTDDKKPVVLSEIYRVLKEGGKVILGEVLVDIEGKLYDPRRLKHIIDRWGYAAENALKYAGAKFAVMEIEAMRQVLMREREMLLSVKQWIELLNQVGFKHTDKKIIDDKLGYCAIYGKK